MNEILKQGELFDESLTQLYLFGYSKRRVILEGGFQDDWSRVHSVNPIEIVIADDVTRLNIREKIGHAITRLTLVSLWQGTKVVPADPLKDRRVEFNLLGYDCLQSVASAVVEDGRIFFNLALLEGSNPRNASRLDRFIEELKEKTGGTNPVSLFFTPQGRKQFNGSDIEIYA